MRRRRAVAAHAEDKAYRGAASRLTVDLELAAVPADDAEHHREAEPRASLALGGEEWLETAPPGVLVHADARVRHLDDNSVARRACTHALHPRAASACRLRASHPPHSARGSSAPRGSRFRRP